MTFTLRSLSILTVVGVMLGAAAARAGILPPKLHPNVCTEQYQPVCGELGAVRKTYSNACFAKGACSRKETGPSR